MKIISNIFVIRLLCSIQQKNGDFIFLHWFFGLMFQCATVMDLMCAWWTRIKKVALETTIGVTHVQIEAHTQTHYSSIFLQLKFLTLERPVFPVETTILLDTRHKFFKIKENIRPSKSSERVSYNQWFTYEFGTIVSQATWLYFPW